MSTGDDMRVLYVLNAGHSLSDLLDTLYGKESHMSENQEIRALLKGWQTFLKSVPESRKAEDRYYAGVKACAEALAAVLGPEENEDG